MYLMKPGLSEAQRSLILVYGSFDTAALKIEKAEVNGKAAKVRSLSILR